MTIAAGSIVDETRRAEIDAVVRTHGSSVQWRDCARAGRSHALVQCLNEGAATAIAAAAQAQGCTPYDRALIVLAVFPSVAEALPKLLAALDGDGRPAGVRFAECCSSGGVIVAWDPMITTAQIVLGVIDIELDRFGAGRTAELLVPLNEESSAYVAADGLKTPSLTVDRILERLVRRAGLHV